MRAFDKARQKEAGRAAEAGLWELDVGGGGTWMIAYVPPKVGMCFGSSTMLNGWQM